MRIDDIFEAMTDIDDKFIEAARPLEPLHDGQPVTVTPAPRRARWKTIVPAAACIAAVLTTTAIGGKYVYTKTHSAASESITFWYPEEAQYRINGSIVLNNFGASKNSNGIENRFLDEEMYAKNYEELAEQSDLIVAGTFADDLHQTQDPDKIHVSESHEQVLDEFFKGGSYNYLSVERVLKGTTESNFVLIHQLASTHLNGGGEYIVHTNDYLSPMIKGDSWVYFLKKSEDGFYIPVNGPQGRYPVPGVNNSGITLADNIPDCLDDFGAYHAAPEANRAEIYEELIDILNTENTPPIRQIGVPGESFNTFTIEEFEGVEFKVSRLGVTADDVEVFSMGDGMLDNLFLADLNGDGMRELCATITEDTRSRAVVRDFVSGDYYTLGGKREYILSVKDNVLNVTEHMWASLDLSTMSIEPLTLGKMLRTIPNKDLRLITLDDEDTFCLEEYPDIPFRASESGVTVDETQFGYLRHVIFGGVELEKLFLADITGDGKRELIALGTCNGESETLAYDIESDETRIISGTAGYTVYGNDGMLVTLNGEMLTFDMMPKTDTMDYSKVSLEHHGMFDLPDFENFEFMVDKQYFTSFDISYPYRGSLELSTLPSEVYFCDIDGDGHREIIMNGTHHTDAMTLEPGARIAVYDVMETGELGKAEYEGRVIEENGRLLLETASGISELKYSKADLWPVVERNAYHINLDKPHKVGLSGLFSTEQDYDAEIISGRLKITHNDELLFKSDDEFGEMCMVRDEENDRIVFAFTNKTNGCIDAFMLTEQSTKHICLNDVGPVADEPINANDIMFEFNEGTRISYYSLLEQFED